MNLGPFFASNLEAMRSTHPTQAETLAAVAPRLQNRLYHVRQVQDGFLDVDAPSPLGSSQRLYGNASPHEVLSQWLETTQVTRQRMDTLVVVGGGLGDHVDILRKHLPPHAILAWVEPDALLFMTAFAYCDLSPLICDSRVHLFIGSPAAKTVENLGNELQWNRFLTLSSAVAIHPMVHRGNPAYANEFQQCWNDSLEREQLYRRARVQSGEPVVMNTLANACGLIRFPGVHRLFHHFDDVPTALVSAGPSLNKCLDRLHEIRDRLLIACVNTAYPVLRKHNIEPHFVITMDHNERNCKSFEGAPPAEHTWLIADPRIHPDIIKRFEERVFLASWRTTTEEIGQPNPIHRIPVPEKSGNAIYDWLQQALECKGDVFGPGSVAVVAFHILARMGCRPLILLGQDLAFAEEEQYAAGTIFEDKHLPQDSKATRQVKDVEGKTVATSETLYLYRKLLEHEISRFDTPVYNSSMGAAIEGTVSARFENVIPELPARQMDIHALIRSLHGAYRSHCTRADLQKELHRGIEAVEALQQEVRRQLQDLPAEFPDDMDTDELARIEQHVKSLVPGIRETHAFAFSLLNEILQEAHFDFEDSQCRIQTLHDPAEKLIESIRRHTRVMDAIITRCDFLQPLLVQEMHSHPPSAKK